MSEMMQGILVVAVISIAFGVWEVTRLLRTIQSDVRLLRVAKYGNSKPEGWE